MAPSILSAARMWLTEAGFVLNSCTVTGRMQVKDSKGAGNKAGKRKVVTELYNTCNIAT